MCVCAHTGTHTHTLVLLLLPLLLGRGTAGGLAGRQPQFSLELAACPSNKGINFHYPCTQSKTI